MKMVRIVPTDKADKAVKGAGEKVVPYITALQNVKNSGGAYEIRPLKSEAPAPVARSLDDMDRQELLLMATSLGMKTDKQMKVSDVKAFINDRLSKIELLDDTDEA